MKLFAVHPLASGTGEAQAAAVYAALEDWNLTNHVNFTVFDTTSSNTGVKAGACVLLEQKMEKQLVAVACRHHIHELIAAKAFKTLIEPSTSGP
jgi:3-oxoacyl-(acyl-carrier-protein) synthase